MTKDDDVQTTTFACLALHYSDIMVCHYCALSWDTNDSAPPQCRPEDWRSTAEHRKHKKLPQSEMRRREQ